MHPDILVAFAKSGSVGKNLPEMQESQEMPGSSLGHASLGEGTGTPLQDSCLENPVDRGAWPATVYGVAELDTTAVI